MPEGMKAIGGVGNDVFEIVQDLVGYTELCFIRADNPELYRALFKKVGDKMVEIWRRFLEEYGEIYTVVRFGDDLGFKPATLLPPEDIRKYIIPQYKRIVDLVHFYFKNSLRDESFFPVYIPLSTVGVVDFYKQLNDKLKGESLSLKCVLFKSIQERIIDMAVNQNRVPLIIIDEVHLLKNENFFELQIITNFNMDSLDPAILILSAQNHLNDRLIMIDVETPVGSNLDSTRRVITTIEDIVNKNVPEKEKDFIQIGRRGDESGHETENIGSVWLFLSDREERDRDVDEIIRDLRKETKDIPGTTIRNSKGHGGMGGSSGLTLSLKGYDLKKGKELAEKIKAIMEDIEIVTDVRISRQEGLPEYLILVDRERAAQYGLSVSQVGITIKRAVAGESVANVILDGEEVGILVRLQEKDRLKPEDLNLIYIDTPMGMQVPLVNLVKTEKSFGPVEIEREAQQRVIYINAHVQGDMKKAVSRIKAGVRKLAMSAGFTIIYGGSWKDFQETLKDLIFVMFLAILLVYFIMAAQFESLFDPFLIMFTLPMTFIGVVWMHLITGTTFNAVSVIGLVMLAGIVVNNGIILVDYTNLLRKRGYDLLDAVKLAGRTTLAADINDHPDHYFGPYPPLDRYRLRQRDADAHGTNGYRRAFSINPVYTGTYIRPVCSI